MANILANILAERNLSIALFATIIVLFPLIIILCEKVIVPFLDERSYIKMEMSRSGSSSERRYWRKELLKLYFEKIPFIGRLFR